MSEKPASNTLDVDPTVTNPDTMYDAGLDLESLDVNNSKNQTLNLGSRPKLDLDPTVTDPITMMDKGLRVDGGKRRTRKNKKKSAKRKRKSAKKSTYRRRR